MLRLHFYHLNAGSQLDSDNISSRRLRKTHPKQLYTFFARHTRDMRGTCLCRYSSSLGGVSTALQLYSNTTVLMSAWLTLRSYHLLAPAALCFALRRVGFLRSRFKCCVSLGICLLSSVLCVGRSAFALLSWLSFRLPPSLPVCLKYLPIRLSHFSVSRCLSVRLLIRLRLHSWGKRSLSVQTSLDQRPRTNWVRSCPATKHSKPPAVPLDREH